MTDDLNARRKAALQRVITDAALDLFEHTGSSAFMLPIPGTTPPLYVAVGTAQDIVGLAEGK
jgi:NAD(P)H-nitrite reductase large subunit